MKKSDLLKEIAELRKKLDLSENWMRRQVIESQRSVEHDRVHTSTRERFQNALESWQIEILERAIEGYFGTLLHHVPPLTRERLLDAEIQWYMLQRFPRMDAVGLAVTYQKLLDSLIDVSIVVPLREFLKRRSTRLPDHPTPLERDILKLTERQYHLSFGRLYELIQMFRNQKTTPFLSQLEHFLIEHNHTFYRFITSLGGFQSCKMIMDMEVFTTKRHAKKVSYSEARTLRTIMVGSLRDKDSLLRMWFETGV